MHDVASMRRTASRPTLVFERCVSVRRRLSSTARHPTTFRGAATVVLFGRGTPTTWLERAGGVELSLGLGPNRPRANVLGGRLIARYARHAFSGVLWRVVAH